MLLSCAMASQLTAPARARRHEEFLREILASGRPVSGEERARWFSAFEDSVGRVFAPRKRHFWKPGQPAEMVKARVLLEPEDSEPWEVIYLAIEREWREGFAQPQAELHTHAWFEGARMVYEFALSSNGHYLTGSITVERIIE